MSEIEVRKWAIEQAHYMGETEPETVIKDAALLVEFVLGAATAAAKPQSS